MAASLTSLLRCNISKKLVPRNTFADVPIRNLNLQEYQSKNLLQDHSVVVQKFRLLDSSLDTAPLKDFKANEYVIKAQVLAGGRGKGHFNTGFKSGVHLTKNPNEIVKLAKEMIGNKLITKQTPPDGIVVKKVMVAESVNIVRETYFCILMDRQHNGPVLVASPAGGMDIEKVAKETPHLLKTVAIDIYEGITDKMAEDVADFLLFKGELRQKCAIEIKKLWDVFCKVDAIQLEINPLVETDDNRVVAVDAKLDFDDNSKYRQKDIFAMDDTSDADERDLEAAKFNLNYITLDGNIACLGNGAGLSMATMDEITVCGGSAANFLDCGGGVNPESVQAAFRIIQSNPNVKAILINIFGGIVNCTTIATGIIAACRTEMPKIPVVVRLAGTNASIAIQMLDESGLPLISAQDMHEAAIYAVSKVPKMTKQT